MTLLVIAPAALTRAHDRLVHDPMTGEYSCEPTIPCSEDVECTDQDVCRAPPDDPATRVCQHPDGEVWCCDAAGVTCTDGTCVPVDSSGPGDSPGEVCLRSDAAPFCNTVSDGEIPRSVVDQCHLFGDEPRTHWADGDCDGDTTPNGAEGRCPCVSCDGPARVDGGGAPRPVPTTFTFRGSGGCVCGVGTDRRSALSWLFVPLVAVAWLARQRRA
jgi:hypothetical protein